jgi:hypothetical protein
LEPERQSLFVDTTRADEPRDFRPLLSALETRREAPHSHRLLPIHLFLPNEKGTTTRTTLLHEAKLKSSEQLAQRYHVDVIEYGHASAVSYIPWSGGPNVLVPCSPQDVDFTWEDKPERLKSGVLLAYTLADAIRKIKLHCEKTRNDELINLCNKFLRSWAADKWTTILRYAVALASAKSRPYHPCDLPFFEDRSGY